MYEHHDIYLTITEKYVGQQEIVGNNAKGQISKRVFQENKARQFFLDLPFCLLTNDIFPSFEYHTG